METTEKLMGMCKGLPEMKRIENTSGGEMMQKRYLLYFCCDHNEFVVEPFTAVNNHYNQ